MNIKLKYKTKDGACFGTRQKITLKEAKELYKNKLEKDENVIEVYCVYFDGWHWHRTHTFKEVKDDKTTM